MLHFFQKKRLRKIFLTLSTFFLSLFLSGCITNQQSSSCLSITENVWYCFVPDTAPLQSALHMVHVKGIGVEERMVVQMESKDTTVSLAVVSPIGQPVLSLVWNGKRLTAQSILGDAVTRHSKRLFMFVQWLKWPENQMLKGFRGGGYTGITSNPCL